MTTNPNEVPRHDLAPSDLDQLWAQGIEDLQRRHDDARRAAEWPRDVEQLLATIVAQGSRHAETLASLHGRISALESALGRLRQ